MKKSLLMAALLLLATATACHSQNRTNSKTKNMKTLVVYYSLSGNTEGIARQAAHATGADLERIETAEPYTGDYQKIVADAQREVEHNYKRPIKPLKHDVSRYDRIVVGTPTWWYKMASPVLTFLSTANLKGKTVVPFMTNAGWPGTVIADMTRVAQQQGATVKNAHEFKFNTHDDGTTTGMATPQKELNNWIETLK